MMKHVLLKLGFLIALGGVFLQSCSDDDDAGTGLEVVASFQFEIGTDNFLEVTFSNFSQNATSYSWNFGDGNTSTQENPVHTYEEGGTYSVTLTATGAGGAQAERTEQVTVIDPLAAQRALIGEDGKTWMLLADASTGVYPIEVGPQNRSEIWFAVGLQQPICERACIFDDTWTFNTDGTYTFENNGDFWAEGGVWPEPGCFDTSAPGAFTGADGQDLSGWDSGTHEFEYTPGNQTLTVFGGFIGLSKVTTNGEANQPQESVSYKVIRLVESQVDTLILETNLEDAGGYWRFVLVSYNNPSDKIIVDICEPTECVPLTATSPSELSHTFASNDPSEWNLLQVAESASAIELGVDDPTDATAPKVGKFIRTGAQFQELQFKLDPANAINFENMTTISLEVYLPSSNDYAGALTDNVFVGFGATECPPNWWEDLHQYEMNGLAKDEWVTVTFQLDNPTFVAVPGNGATVNDRNDLDMVYIQIGGGNHTVEAEFFVRNFSIQ
jgi:PKD repeat protein